MSKQSTNYFTVYNLQKSVVSLVVDGNTVFLQPTGFEGSSVQLYRMTDQILFLVKNGLIKVVDR